MSYSHQFKNSGGILVSGSLLDSQGQEKLFYKEFNSSDTNNGIAENADADKNYRFFTKISFHDFTFSSAHLDRTKNVPTAAYETVFNDSRLKTVEKQTYVEMKYAHEFGKQLDLDARIFYDRYQFDADYPFEEGLNQDYALGQSWGSELKLTKTFFERHKIIAGVEYEDFFNQDQTNGDVGSSELFLDAKESSEVLAIYLQDEFDILENLTLNAGVRYDHYSTFGSTTNPRASLIYNPFNATVVKFLFGQAFRSPNAFEFYYEDDGESQKANPELGPETIKTYELVLEQELGENLRGTMSGFLYNIKDLISQRVDPADGLAVFKNIDEVEAKGIEMELSGKWEKGIMGKISYSFQETEDETTGEILKNSPRHLFKYKLSVPFMQEKIFAGIEGRYTGKRKTEGGNEESGYFVTDLTIFSESLVSGLEVSGSIYNLFNATYSDPGTAGVHTQDVIEQDGIDYRLKLLYKF
tara:strand:- start:2671 stop:4077 length:1407 start_codon:yes stop_codon:yes gene_type:complete